MIGNYRLLLVEDDRAQQQTLYALLTREGLSVTVCDSVEEALQHLTQEQFEVCILDQNLRGSAGTELFKRIPPGVRTRFVIHTAYPSIESAKDAVNRGVFAYCEKLGNPRELFSAIHNAIHDYLATELLDAENELRLQVGLLDAVQQAVVATDLQFQLLYMNQFAETLYGVTAAELKGTSVRHLLFPRHADSDAEELLRLLADGRSWSAEFPDGCSVSADTPLELTVSPVLDQDGRLIGMTSIATDISERIRLRREHESLQHQFFQSQKMESIGRLAGGIAHDFNNLLCAIQVSAELLQRRGTLLPADLDAVEMILRSGGRARELTRQLLAFSRKQKLNLQAVNLNTVIREFSGLLKRTLREDIRLHLTLQPDLPCIEGDVVQLEQVLLNLAVNAQDAMPEGGQLTIATEVTSVHRSPGEKTTGDAIRLTVADTGQGIPSELTDQIFEPFFSTKPSDKGTGLGLATVQGVVHQLGGQISVESLQGRGTSFHLDFPVTEKSEMPVVAGHTASIESSAPPGRILLVEDNDAVRRVTETILRNAGHTVYAHASPQTALEFHARHVGQIDVLVTDFMMPGLNGVDLANHVSKRDSHVKVLFMSAFAEQRLVVEGLSEQSAFIEKPFTIAALTGRVQDLLRQQRGESAA